MKRCHDHSNAYKGKQLPGAGDNWFVCLHHGRKMVEQKGSSKTFISRSPGSRKKKSESLGLTWASKPESLPSGTLPPKWPHLLHHSPCSNPFQSCHPPMHLWGPFHWYYHRAHKILLFCQNLGNCKGVGLVYLRLSWVREHRASSLFLSFSCWDLLFRAFCSMEAIWTRKSTTLLLQPLFLSYQEIYLTTSSSMAIPAPASAIEE